LAKNFAEPPILYINNFYLKINLDLDNRDLTKKNEGNRPRNGFLGGDISFIIEEIFSRRRKGVIPHAPLGFLTSWPICGKKVPRTPYETCKPGSRRITLLEYDNRSPKNCLSPKK
jgi:hypothetical protein